MTDIRFAAAAGGTVPAYLAVPDGEGPWPGVVIVHDAFGMTADIRRIADRFAANGYLAMVPALYQHGRKPACIVSTFRSLSAGRGVAVDDIVAARDHLVADARCSGRVASVGFCMGGGFCLLLAPRGVFDATSVNYGLLPDDLSTLRGSCPMVASYGADDSRLAGAAARIEVELVAGGVPHDVKEYPGVGHSFMNDWDTPAPLRRVVRTAGLAYSAPEAEDAWLRILAFFDEHLAAAPTAGG
jgi:carboxymethylenebutenolidase